MELYKLENGKLIKFNGGFVVYNNRIYTNPTEEMVRKVGYKDLHVDEQPKYDIETQYIEKIYEDTKDAVLVHWEVNDTPEISESGEY